MSSKELGWILACGAVLWGCSDAGGVAGATETDASAGSTSDPSEGSTLTQGPIATGSEDGSSSTGVSSSSSDGTTGATPGSESTGSSGEPAGSSDSGSSGDTGSSSSTGEPGLCAGFDGETTPAETALTPMSNEEAEILAIEATDEVVAPPAVHDRIDEDLAAIRAAHAEVAGVVARPSWDPSAIIVAFTDTGAAAAAAGTYDAWDCPNELYKVSEIALETLNFVNWTVVTFDGRYNVPRQILDYQDLPEIDFIDANALIGDGPDVCVSIEGDTHTYIFDDASGDCPAGCTEHTYWGFTTAGDGSISELGSFGTGMPTPLWFSSAGACTERL